MQCLFRNAQKALSLAVAQAEAKLAEHGKVPLETAARGDPILKDIIDLTEVAPNLQPWGRYPHEA